MPPVFIAVSELRNKMFQKKCTFQSLKVIVIIRLTYHVSKLVVKELKKFQYLLKRTEHPKAKKVRGKKRNPPLSLQPPLFTKELKKLSNSRP